LGSISSLPLACSVLKPLAVVLDLFLLHHKENLNMLPRRIVKPLVFGDD